MGLFYTSSWPFCSAIREASGFEGQREKKSQKGLARGQGEAKKASAHTHTDRQTPPQSVCMVETQKKEKNEAPRV